MNMRDKMIRTRKTPALNWCWGDRVDTAPVRWSSSERPLSVRTVWVGSVRHAILSTDDPLSQYRGQPGFQRPESSYTSSGSDTSSVSSNELEECLVKLRVALDSAEKTCLPPIENNSIGTSNGDPSRCTSPALSVLPQNPLSERVLQWLDLASKGHTTTTTLLPKRTRNIPSSAKPPNPKRKIHARSATVDIPQITERRLSSSILKTTAKESSAASPSTTPAIKDELVNSSDIQIPYVMPQRYEPLRPLTAWPSSSKPSRPQLHIFIPPLEQTAKIAVEISDIG